MTRPAPTARPGMDLAYVLRIVALVFFILAIVCGYTWGLTSWHWEGLTATGLAAWCASTLAW
jgi:hypothetical protein